LVQQQLNQAWAGFNAQIARDYSSVTLTVPQQADGRVKISFVDAFHKMNAHVTAPYLILKIINWKKLICMPIKSSMKNHVEHVACASR